jgi:hypothetical protein
MEEGLSIGDEILEIAKLRPVYGRVVDLRNNAVPDRKPEMAGSGICCAYAGLVATGPAGLGSRLSERFLADNLFHL